MRLGYYISPTKSSIVPTQQMVHLGFGIDSRSMSYSVTPKYRAKFRKFRLELLERGTANLLDLQRWVGKCNHLRLVFPGNSLFTHEVRLLMPGLGEARVPLSRAAVEEIEFWGFVDYFSEPVPFLLQQHVSLRLFTDASGYGWGASVLLPGGPTTLRDYWSSDLFSHDICSKEALAVLFAVQALEPEIACRRVDVYVDNEGLVHAWAGLKSRSSELAGVLRSLFLLTIDLRVSLKLIWVPTDANPADAPSRALERLDSMLSGPLRARLWSCLGPFSFDLMALPSNVFRCPSGRPLPFFSRFPTPSAAGTDVFAQRAPAGRLYAFPPFRVVVPLIRLLMEWGSVEAVLVLPAYAGCSPIWGPLLHPFICESLMLFPPRSREVLLLPSSSGFSLNKLPLPFGLVAHRCCFPPVPAPAPPLPLGPFRVLVVGDSVLRPLRDLSWPAPFMVLVRSLSGASLERAVSEAASFASSSPHALVLHAGVNDASRGGDGFREAFGRSCARLLSRVAPSFQGRSVLLSTVCPTKVADVNIRVGEANVLLRELALVQGWGVVSNDNIRSSDLLDNVHLNAGGIAKLHRNFLSSLRALMAG